MQEKRRPLQLKDKDILRSVITNSHPTPASSWLTMGYKACGQATAPHVKKYEPLNDVDSGNLGSPLSSHSTKSECVVFRKKKLQCRRNILEIVRNNILWTLAYPVSTTNCIFSATIQGQVFDYLQCLWESKDDNYLCTISQLKVSSCMDLNIHEKPCW